MREITLKYKPGSEKPYRNSMYTMGWVMSTILYEGLRRAGKYLDIESFVAALETIRDMDTKGLCGPINFSPTNHKGLYHSKLYKADPESGKLLSITDWRLPPSKK